MSAVIQPKMFKKTTFSRVGIEQNQRLKDGSIKSGSAASLRQREKAVLRCLDYCECPFAPTHFKSQSFPTEISWAELSPMHRIRSGAISDQSLDAYSKNRTVGFTNRFHWTSHTRIKLRNCACIKSCPPPTSFSKSGLIHRHGILRSAPGPSILA
jgi:hypothetical protein